MAVKAMKGERSEAFGAFTKRAEFTDCHSLSTYLYYYLALLPDPPGWSRGLSGAVSSVDAVVEVC